MKEILLGLALEIAKSIISTAEDTEPDYPIIQNPIAVTVAGMNGKPIVTLAMDRVMPISVDLSVKKAYTAVMTFEDTKEWEEKGLNPSNFADPNITCFGGGVLLLNEKKTFIGAVGVSGRHSYQKDKKMDRWQDHELACVAHSVILKELKK